ncbi:MAG: YbaB/EbfC family nucleoid-associated protein [Lachnospiraceae bacterium]|nr:YbaB/EbfC family nucleoid-associated protein [Lachnospiraceae bacterium]MBP5253861.1 YbaB/EbfC family nucleoid-associated protein [Lachnospiraceae bacterium]
MAKHGGYMGGMPGSMTNLMKQAQRMQQKMQEQQAELETKEFTSQSGGGAVTVTVTGKKQVVSVELKPEVVDPDDIEMLQDLIVAAANEALRQVDAWQEEHMSALTGGMGGLGGFNGMF